MATIFVEDANFFGSAYKVARQLGFECSNLTQMLTTDRLQLIYTSKRLALLEPESQNLLYPKYPEITSPDRSCFPLLKSLGRSNDSSVILDLTAGFGRDSFIMASFGYQVYSIEKSPMVAAFLCDKILKETSQQEQMVWQCMLADSHEVLDHYPIKWPSPDIVYMDPMFPENAFKAKVKQTSRLLQDLAETRPLEGVVKPALALARKRVVVKRAKKDNFLDQVKPDYQLKFSRCRFDVYITT